MLTVLVRKMYLVDMARGLKSREYRRYGPRFNERVFSRGRLVRFACEYSGVVGWVEGEVRSLVQRSAADTDVGLEALRAVYPKIEADDQIAVIELTILSASIALSGHVRAVMASSSQLKPAVQVAESAKKTISAESS